MEKLDSSPLIELPTITLSDVLQHFHAPKVMDYLSLDIEGAEELVWTGFNASKFRFNVITVERPTRGLVHMLEQSGYTYLGDLGGFGDALWIHATHLSNIGKSLSIQYIKGGSVAGSPLKYIRAGMHVIDVKRFPGQPVLHGG